MVMNILPLCIAIECILKAQPTEIKMDYTREQLIALLEANDHNGCYSDSDCLLEFGCIAPTSALIECAVEQELI